MRLQIQILILTVVIMAVVAVCIYAFVRSSKGSERTVDDGEIKGWTWDGELVRGAIKEGKGVWKPFYEKRRR